MSAETLEARESRTMYSVLKDQNFQPRILHLAKLSFRYEGEIKAFSDKQKLKEFTPRSVLQEMLKGFQAEKKTC